MGRIVKRILPDGSIRTVYPFHISLQGMETMVLCRDENDYDAMEKLFFVSAWRCNTIVIIHIVMSNHGHLSVLATDIESVRRTGELIKKNYSQYLSRKYGESGSLSRTDIDAQYLDTDWYVRNALAYIPRNALDAGSRIDEYKWSGYDAMFFGKSHSNDTGKRVKEMTRRERESLFRTHTDISCVPWRVDNNGYLIHSSACDHDYLESVFNNDPGYFLRVIGVVNTAEMEQKLISNHHQRQADSEFLLNATAIAERWFKKDISQLTMEMKCRLIPYMSRCYRTSVSQIARCFRLDKQSVTSILNKSGIKTA